MGETLGRDESVRETARRLFRANELNPDPNTSAVVATAAMLGLAARERDGAGQAVFVDMFGANAWANFDAFVEGAERASLGADLTGTAPERRLYRCSDGWLFVAAPSIGILEGALDAQADSVAVRLADLTVERALALLAAAGVPALRADAGLPGARLLDEAFFIGHGYVDAVEHPRFGRVLRHGSVVRAGATTARPPCAQGDSTRSVLAEVGFDDDEIARLETGGH
jgi:crotonobetainyl-CoA:carnitine CoA-transferase CaiB-like acyl-CoA transferase